MSTALKPRSPVEIIDASIQIIRLYIVQFATIAVVSLLPATVMHLLLPAVWSPLVSIAERLGYLFASAGIAFAVSEAYLGREPSAGAALHRVGQRFGSVFGASFIQGFLVFIGTILLFIPGIIAFAWTFAMQQVVMIEGINASESFTRSRALAKGYVGKILVTLGVTYIVFFILVFGVALLFGIFGDGRIVETIASVVGMVIYTVVATVNTLLYYDLRIRKEGFDIEMMAAELGNAPMQPR